MQAKPLVSIADDFPIPVTSSVVGFIITSQQFARSVSKPCSVQSANDFAFTVSDVFVFHTF
jgi:hypothetical protein